MSDLLSSQNAFSVGSPEALSAMHIPVPSRGDFMMLRGGVFPVLLKRGVSPDIVIGEVVDGFPYDGRIAVRDEYDPYVSVWRYTGERRVVDFELVALRAAGASDAVPDPSVCRNADDGADDDGEDLGMDVPHYDFGSRRPGVEKAPLYRCVELVKVRDDDSPFAEASKARDAEKDPMSKARAVVDSLAASFERGGAPIVAHGPELPVFAVEDEPPVSFVSLS